MGTSIPPGAQATISRRTQAATGRRLRRGRRADRAVAVVSVRRGHARRLRDLRPRAHPRGVRGAAIPVLERGGCRRTGGAVRRQPGVAVGHPGVAGGSQPGTCHRARREAAVQRRSRDRRGARRADRRRQQQLTAGRRARPPALRLQRPPRRVVRAQVHAGRDRPEQDTWYLERVLDDLDAEHAVYVGDRASDVAAAHAAGSTQRSSTGRSATPSSRNRPRTNSTASGSYRRHSRGGSLPETDERD